MNAILSVAKDCLDEHLFIGTSSNPLKLPRGGRTPARPYSVPFDQSERLPFTIRVVTTPQELQKAVEIRASAYERHMPTLGQALRTPEVEDLKSDVLVLLAERKFDSQPIGSMRM